MKAHVSTAFSDILFKDCANIISIDVLSLTDSTSGYTISAKAKGARIFQDSNNQHHFTLIPSKNDVTIKLGIKGQGDHVKSSLRKLKFKAIIPPPPRIILIVNGKEHDGLSPISRGSRLVIKVLPDKLFCSQMPHDSDYALNRIELLAQHSLGQPSRSAVFSGAGHDAGEGIKISLKRLGTAEPGTKIYLRIDRLFRINFENQLIPVDLDQNALIIDAVIK